ncbi:hypothetical protein TCAL_05323 [Tigriopus californicus]|uniref:Ionotropic glutamate receptor C-terminal domain-containing protein n=1 Tax=Tigriopus californicus TaxID=6832 RepID=A0A553PFY6_TIGCA|nr:hypothetical protein TCAL_05323 [Tigriopus californicus]
MCQFHKREGSDIPFMKHIYWTKFGRMLALCGVVALMVPTCTRCGLIPTNRNIMQDTLLVLDQVKISYNEVVLLGSDRFPREFVPRFGTQSLKVNGKFLSKGNKHSKILSLWFVNSLHQVPRDCRNVIPIAARTKMHKASLVIGTNEEMVPSILVCLGHSLSIDSSVFFVTTLPNNTQLRRNNLERQEFSSITGPWAPFINEIQTSKINPMDVTFVDGIYVDAMRSLGETLNFTTRIQFNANYSWNQMVEKISNGSSFSIGLTGFSQTLERFLITDFSIPFSSTTVRILYPADSDRSPLHIYMGSFLVDAWGGIACSLLTCFVVLCSFAWMQKLSFQTERKLELSISFALVFVLLSHLGRRVPREPKANSLRLAFFSISFGGFILISLYRAMLGASLAVKIHQPPIRSMEELVVSDLSVLISQGTSVYKYFSTAMPSTPQYELFHQKIRGHEDPNSPDEMEILNKMAQGLLPKSILIGVYQPLSVSPSYPCQVRSLPKDFRTVGNGLMKERGVFQQLEQKWSTVQDVSTCFPQESRKIEASMEHVLTLFGVWFVGILVSGCACFGEIILSKVRDSPLPHPGGP